MRLTESMLRRMVRREMKGLVTEARRPRLVGLIFEDADPSKIDSARFPMKLSAAAADPEMKNKTSRGTADGDKKDDVVSVSGGNWAVKDLKPSQSTMKVSNAVGMAIGMLVKKAPGGDLNAFVSSDNSIMDGHHRWIASYMCDPSASVSGKAVNLPGDKLVAVLNAVTAGRLGHKGNPGKGSFADFNDKNKIVSEINTVVEKGVPKFEGDKQVGFFTTPEDAKKIVDEKGGAEALADMFIKNLSTATLSTPSWAVERVEMPVINPGEDASTTEKALKGGEVDLNPPYAEGEGEKQGEEEKKVQKAGYHRRGGVLIERWQRLAGIK